MNGLKLKKVAPPTEADAPRRRLGRVRALRENHWRGKEETGAHEDRERPPRIYP